MIDTKSLDSCALYLGCASRNEKHFHAHFATMNGSAARPLVRLFGRSMARPFSQVALKSAQCRFTHTHRESAHKQTINYGKRMADLIQFLSTLVCVRRPLVYCCCVVCVVVVSYCKHTLRCIIIN